MSHLPPPPPNAAPYAPPPPPGQQPYQYPSQYQPQGSYQPPPPHQRPPPPHYGGHNGYQPEPPRGPPPLTGQDKGQKSKMVITRYARPPPNPSQYPPRQPAYQSQQYPGYPQPPPPPASAGSYPPSTWGPPPPQQYPPPPAGYAPPPPSQGGSYSQPYPAPPPPQLQHQHQPHYSGYGQQPQAYPPPPSSQVPPAQPYAPPPPATQHTTWGAPPAQYQPQLPHPPQPAWSPPPAPISQQQPPPVTITPAPSMTPAPPSQHTPAPEFVIKDRNDPTFYDGWDDEDYEFGAALWPGKGEQVVEEFSIGQYIWHPPVRVTLAIPSNVDDEVPLATAAQTNDPKANLVASKYFQGESGEGLEYVYNFQRIRYVDSWSDSKNDPLFKVFTEQELHEDVIPADNVLEQVLSRGDEPFKSSTTVVLDEALTTYLNGADAPGKSTEAEQLLASLGVSGTPKPVYSTPFPAYAPPPEELALERAALERQTPGRTPSAQVKRVTPTRTPQRGLPPPPPVQSTNTIRHPPTPHANSHGNHTSPPSVHPGYQYPPPPHIAHYPQQTAGQPNHFPAPPPHVANHYPPQQYSAHHPPPPPQAQPQQRGNQRRSPSYDPWNDDPWKVTSAGARRETPPDETGPGTPAGSDFGDFPTNGNNTGTGSQGTPTDGLFDPIGTKKRKTIEDEEPQRKRSKPKIAVASAYQRRW